MDGWQDGAWRYGIELHKCMWRMNMCVCTFRLLVLDGYSKVRKAVLSFYLIIGVLFDVELAQGVSRACVTFRELVVDTQSLLASCS
jgi:hypothetical protein